MKRSMDDLLRDTLRARAADPAAACLDPETAAALVDRTLPARARSGAEAHVADCPRCQAVLAALVRSTPPPIERAWWRRPAVAWLAPLTVAATAVAIWINVPDTGNRAPVQTLRDEAPPIESSPIQSPPTAAPAAPQAQSQIGSVADARFVAPEVLRAREAAALRKARLARAAPDASAGSVDARQVAAASPTPAAAPAPAAAAPQARRADAASSAEPNVGRAIAAEPLRGAALAETTVTVTAPSPVALDPLTTRSLIQQITIISPNRDSQWRIGFGSLVQHSTDGGSTWRTQATGVNVTLAAGSSPSPSVCWLVGPGGLVLITTDEGQSWRRVPFPVVTDLVSVRATNESTATIVTSDGRTFVTSDGGRNWRR
jgi:photosystem II stability/assembly factor-like uncharacterized protein